MTYGNSSLKKDVTEQNITLRLSIVHPSEINGARTYNVQFKSKIWLFHNYFKHNNDGIIQFYVECKFSTVALQV